MWKVSHLFQGLTYFFILPKREKCLVVKPTGAVQLNLITE